MRLLGLIIIVVAILVSLYWFLPMAARDGSASLSQYLGAAALIAMGILQLLATRWKALEFVFGGLDLIYVLHKWLSIGAMAAILVHDTLDAEIDRLGGETWLSDLAETLGEVSLYGFLILVTLTLVTFIPYHLWRWTHKLLGGFFLASFFHFAYIQKPFELTDPAGLYVLAFCVLGSICYLITTLGVPRLFFRHQYEVTELRQTGGALSLTLMPVG